MKIRTLKQRLAVESEMSIATNTRPMRHIKTGSRRKGFSMALVTTEAGLWISYRTRNGRSTSGSGFFLTPEAARRVGRELLAAAGEP